MSLGLWFLFGNRRKRKKSPYYFVQIKKYLYLCSRMCSLESLKIDLKEVEKEDKSFVFHLDNQYFEAINAPEVRSGKVDVNLSIRKAVDVFSFAFHISGTVQTPCDRCLDDVDIDVLTDNSLLIKYGETDSTEDDEMWIVTEDTETVDLSWFIYESIVISLPIQHVHAPGKCNPAMIEKLSQYSATRSGDEGENKDIDPRWSKLMELKNNN